jgi:hypothetical protein
VAAGTGRARSFGQQTFALANFEDFVLAVLPESHPDVQARRLAAPRVLRGRRRAQGAAESCAARVATQLVLGFERGEAPSRPFTIDTLHAFIVFLTTTRELPTQGRWHAVSGEATLRGRGAGAPSVDQHMWAIKATENAFSLVSNVDSPAIKSRLTQLRNQHIGQSAPSYDVVEVRATQPGANLREPCVRAARLRPLRCGAARCSAALRALLLVPADALPWLSC